MRKLAGFILLMGGLLLPAVQASAQTQFDGTYAGVSMTLNTSAGITRACGQYPAPSSMTIARGVGQMQWGSTGMMTGNVTPQGMIMLRNDFGATLSGQVDGRGAIRAIVGANCKYDAVWQKR